MSQGKYPKVFNPTRRNLFASIVAYLMVAAVAFRGFTSYPDKRTQIIPLLLVFFILVLIEPLVPPQRRLLSYIYLALQVVLVVILFFVEPWGDIWAILLVPSTGFAMRNFRQTVGFFWVGIFTLAISVMLFYGHNVDAPQYIVIYVAAYLFFTSYTLILKQTEKARSGSQILLSELRDTNRQLQELAAQADDIATIRERNRLARELHDSVTQSIFSMTLITSSALVLQERDPSQVTEKLQQLQGLAHDALGEMRNLINQLRPLSIAEQGLEAVLKEHLNELKSRNNLDVSLTVPPARLPIEQRQQQELFRIIQEALNNICKHALVNQATVAFEVDSGFVTVTIQDHGVGFDPARKDKDPTHFGLSSMRERAQELGGTLDVSASPGEGTRITIRIPILEKE